ncbi:hypothetical protein O7606_02510 [Micromonospora sp. WMMD882]|uniref:hypothetical protein n=1 Tax=Micromonospora sp. WMMD882 TaxID=3015151 RepID=UPI00248C6E98|nr:hypothetical protein [Micromonospora sp. WMMD882]WBB80270.1 hypothetical protein O7606_02510 [Micromonospora sp. WMMD882]
MLDVEVWASGWLGQAWLGAEMGERRSEHMVCMEVVGRACSRPSPHALVAVAALRRVVSPDEWSLLDGAVEILVEGQPAPSWLSAPEFVPVRAHRAADVWDSERVLFVEYGPDDPHARRHTLMAQVTEPGGRMVAKLGVLREDAAEYWSRLRDAGEVPMPVVEVPVLEVLADLAGALRTTDMYWPRPDDEDFVEVRALAWSRCREFLPDWPDVPGLPERQRRELIDTFLAQAYPLGAAGAGGPGEGDVDREVVRSVADVFVDYGHGYITAGLLAWSPGWVAAFLGDWLPRKTILDEAQREALPEVLRRWVRFALGRRGVDAEWIEPVVAAVDIYLPGFLAAVDDESAWGPAKQIAAELTARGVDLSDKAAVDAVIGELNAARLARNLTE